MRKVCPEDFSFYPKTLQIPTDYSELSNLFKNGGKDEKVFIAKPSDQSQGRGIFLITCLNDIPVKDKLVVQQYINK